MDFLKEQKPGTYQSATHHQATSSGCENRSECGSRNVAALPVRFSLKCSKPFSSSVKTVKLDPGEEISVAITFNPASVDTLHCARHESKLKIQYEQVQRTETVKLLGIITRPNLTFKQPQVQNTAANVKMSWIVEGGVWMCPTRTDAQI